MVANGIEQGQLRLLGTAKSGKGNANTELRKKPACPLSPPSEVERQSGSSTGLKALAVTSVPELISVAAAGSLRMDGRKRADG